MESIAYYDGKIGAPEELMVPFNDRVHFFGDGCYDATVGANGKVYLLQDHLDRFFTSAKALDINIPMSKTELAKLAKALNLDAIHDTVHEMARDEARHGKAFAGLLKRYFGA